MAKIVKQHTYTSTDWDYHNYSGSCKYSNPIRSTTKTLSELTRCPRVPTFILYWLRLSVAVWVKCCLITLFPQSQTMGSFGSLNGPILHVYVQRNYVSGMCKSKLPHDVMDAKASGGFIVIHQVPVMVNFSLLSHISSYRIFNVNINLFGGKNAKWKLGPTISNKDNLGYHFAVLLLLRMWDVEIIMYYVSQYIFLILILT